MPKSIAIAGWKPSAAGPKRPRTLGSDVVGAPARILGAKSATGRLKTKLKSDDATKAARKPASTKLRALYMRPIKGADSDAKIVIVDRQNRPVFFQG